MKKILSTLALAAVITISAVTAKAGNLSKTIQPIFKTYENMVNALAQNQPKTVKSQAIILQKQIKALNESKLSGNEIVVWKKSSSRMLEGNKIIINDKMNRLNVQRRSFDIVSKALHNIVKASGGIANMTLYYYYSQKAVSGTGAYWLSDKKATSNPYLGTKGNEADVMLKGTIK